MVSEIVGNAFGQERVVRDSTALLRNSGHQVFHVVAENKGVTDSDGIHFSAELFRLQSLSPLSMVRKIVDQLMTICSRVEADLIHFIDIPDARILRRLTEVMPTVFTAHTVAATCPASGRYLPKGGVCTLRSSWKCLLHNKRDKCLGGFKSDLHRIHAMREFFAKKKELRRVDGVIAISRYVEKELLAEDFDRDRVFYVPNPVTEVPLPLLPSAPRTLLTCAARRGPMTGPYLLLKALKRLENLEWTFWILGDGSSRNELQKLTAELGLSSRVSFLGAVPYASTQQIMASSLAVIQGNTGPEGFGLSVAEASAMGIAVVAFDVPAINEIIEHLKTGYLVAPRDVEGMASALTALLSDPDLAKEFGERGKARMKALYSPDAHLKGTLSVYEACLERRRTGMPAPVHSVVVASSRR